MELHGFRMVFNGLAQAPNKRLHQTIENHSESMKWNTNDDKDKRREVVQHQQLIQQEMTVLEKDLDELERSQQAEARADRESHALGEERAAREAAVAEYEAARALFAADPSTAWASYVAGCVLVLARDLVLGVVVRPTTLCGAAAVRLHDAACCYEK